MINLHRRKNTSIIVSYWTQSLHVLVHASILESQNDNMAFKLSVLKRDRQHTKTVFKEIPNRKHINDKDS